MRIIFMGTPDPAAKCLQALIDAQEQVVCVVSQPDRKKGRGLHSSPSPVKLLAEKYKIPTETPETVKDQIFFDKIKSFAPELIVVVAYGRILPKAIIDLPKYGAINVHASLLPKYRGAAPIQWAMLKGEIKTGVTIMHLDETLDTGDILLQDEAQIDPQDNSETLKEKLFNIGSQTLLKAISQIKNNTSKRTPQKHADATYAQLITKETGEIDFRRSATEINNQVRALVPWPCTHTYFMGKSLRILKANPVPLEKKFEPGYVMLVGGNIVIACGSGALQLETVQYEGGKVLSALDFVNGHNSILTNILPAGGSV
ncbi:methionyl-tRNA formyltransferase [Candidatus Saganbacteria bacterium]|nr:methionyl-tRNA formyltransferase [Candidatus Saganbacteria bacterium]